MDDRMIKKLALTVNSIILAMVFGLMAFFNMSGAAFLTYFSIPTALVYIIGYALIGKGKYYSYVRMVYLWLTFYMGVTTICLGSEYGFHLYCFSMIPVAYTTEYISYKIDSKRVKALPLCLGIAVFYLLCTGYVSAFGSVYESNRFAPVFWLVNAMTVLGFLIYYINYLIKSIIKSEDALKDIAHKDRLTGLYNRHYMAELLDSLPCDETAGSLAMADIDNFKRINDVYGHNAGDIVLKTVSDQLKNICGGCVTARWGGEEFLMLLPVDEARAAELMDGVRLEVSGKSVRYEQDEISVTITAGLSKRQSGQSVDEWIKQVDEKLYCGKSNGKNKVVI